MKKTAIAALLVTSCFGSSLLAQGVDPRAIRTQTDKALDEHVRKMDHHGNRPDLSNKPIDVSLNTVLAGSDYDLQKKCPGAHLSWIPYLQFAHRNAMAYWSLSERETADTLRQVRGVLSDTAEQYVLWGKKLTESQALLEQLSLKTSSSGNAYITGGGGLAKANADLRDAAHETAQAKSTILCFAKLEEAICQALPGKYPSLEQDCSQGSSIAADIFE